MKKSFLFLLAFAVCFAASAGDPRLGCISTAPGEDASTQMRVSWSSDTTVTASHVIFTLAKDRGWKKGTVVQPLENRRCELFEPLEGVSINKFGARLDGLRPDTDYKYVIETEDGGRSGEYHFRTAGARQWSACLVSDIHSGPAWPGRLASAMKMLDVAEGIDPSMDFVLSTGDVVGYSDGYSLWRILFEEPVFSKYMWARVNGNHDNWTKKCSEEERPLVPNHYYPATSFFPRNGYEGEMGVCYHFRYGNAFFVMLNSEDMSRKNGELEAAKRWTRSVIAEARSGACPPDFVVVCMHSHWFNGQTGKAYKYASWSNLFDEAGVDLALAGNNHIYVRSNPVLGGKVDPKGTVYIQTPCSDNSRGRFISDEESYNGDLIACRWTEGKKTVGAVLLSVKGRTMTLTLYDRSGNAVDECVIRR